MTHRAVVMILALLVAFPEVAGTWTSNKFMCKATMGAQSEMEKQILDTGLDRLDIRCGNEVWLGDPHYGQSLQAAVTVIGTKQAALHVSAGTYNINASIIVPANITLKPERGAIFNVATNVTLTINALEAGQYLIFSCDGTGQVVFGTSAAKVYKAAWFAVGDGVTNETTPISKAITATPTGETLQFTAGANYLITGDPALSFNKRINVDFNNCTFLYNDHGTAISIGGVSPRLFEAWCRGHVRILRTEAISHDGSQTASSQLQGTGIKFSYIQNYVAKGPFYVNGFQYGYYFDNQATAMQVHGAQAQDCLIDFYFDPSSASGAFTTCIDLYSPFTVFNPAFYSSIAGSRGACFVKKGRTNDGHNIFGGNLESLKERKLYVEANWCSFNNVYWDVSTGHTDIEFAPGAQQNRIDGGSGLSLMKIIDKGSNTDIQVPNKVWQDLTGAVHAPTGFIGNLTGNVNGNVSGSAGSCLGNAATATSLAVPRAINDQNFNGSAAITVPVNNTDDHATNAAMPILFTPTQNGNYGAKTNRGFTFNPSNNQFYVNGNVIGNNVMSSTYFGDYNNGSKMRFPSDGAIQFKNNAGSMSLKVDFASQITVNGSKSGSYTWSMPFQGNVYKKFVIYFNALNDSGKTITYPTAFTKTPYIYGVVAATAIMSTNNIALTLAPSSDVTGFAFVEGY